MGVSPPVFKVIAAVVLLVIAIVGACGPLVLVRYGKGGSQGKRSLAFVLGNMLSAGVMVSAGFVHLLGAAIIEMGALRKGAFPWAPFLCAAGFLVTLIADQLATSLSGGKDGHQGQCHSQASATPVRRGTPGGHAELGAEGLLIHRLASGGGSGSSGAGASPPTQARAAAAAAAAGKERSSEMVAQKPSSSHSLEAQSGTAARQALTRKQAADSNGSAAANGNSPGEERRGLLPGASPPSDSSAWDGAMLAQAQRSPRKGRRRDTDEDLPAVSFVTAVLMAVALCFHSVLEGAAVGAQDNVVDTAHIFIAIAAHKGLAAYALGSSLVDSQATAGRFWSVIGTFAMATPLGIGLGMLLSSLATGHMAAGVSALASGTFLYVAFMEIIPRELEDPGHRVAKLGMMVAGFAAMSVLAIWA